MLLFSKFQMFPSRRMVSRHYLRFFSKNESTKPVAVRWKCIRPSDRRHPGLVKFTEDTVTAIARRLGKEKVVIR